MANRTVSVYLKARFGEYLAASAAAERRTRDVRQEVDRLNRSGSAFTKAGLIMGLASVPSLAAPAVAALGTVPALALSGAAALGVMKVATNGVGDAMKAVADGDADAFDKAMAGLSAEAKQFVLAYEQVKPVLDDLGDRTQDAFFGELNGSLETLTGAYLPMLMQQMPKVAGSIGKAGSEFTAWASAPSVVNQVNRQFSLGADLVGDFGGLLRSGTALLLDMADAGGEFARELVQGTTRGTDSFRRWLETARAQGQINDLFDNAKRILAAVTEVAAEAGDTLFDVVANPALVNGAETFLDILGLLLQVVHGVLGVFELLPSGMQGFVATSIAVGAAVLILAGRVMALKASLISMKQTALTSGAALKSMGGFMMGPWGIALTVGTTLLGAFSAAQANAEAETASLTSTLDKETGAVTAATREQVANNLAKSGALDLAQQLGLNIEELTTAVLGGADATQRYYDEQVRLAGGADKLAAGFSPLRTEIGKTASQIDAAKAGFIQHGIAVGKTGAAVDTTTGAYTRQEAAVKSLGDRLRAESDPAFALIKAQKDLAAAQTAYTKAVDAHGPKSKEAEAAALGLAQQSIELAGAVDAAGASFDGKLSPQLKAAMRASGMTSEQIAILEKALKDAKTSGDAFAKNYAASVTVTSPGLDAALRKMERLAYLNKKMGFSVNAYDPEGLVRNKRWGGVTTYAATGALRQADRFNAGSSPLYGFAERETGGEIFAPRYGDMARTRSIVSYGVENWWGGWGNFVPGGSYGRSGGSMHTAPQPMHAGGGRTIIVQLIDPMSGKVTRQAAIDEATSRGIPQSRISAAYP